MAKTNSRVKKPATFTPASTGKSTFKPLTANTKLSNAGGFKPLTANTNTSTSVGQFVKGNKTFKYKAPNKTVAPTVKTTTAPASNTTSIYKGRGGVSKGGSQGTANKYANKKPVITKTKPLGNSNLPAVKGNTSSSVTKTGTGKIEFTKNASKFGKLGKLAGKAAGIATLVEIGKTLYDKANENSKAIFKREKDRKDKAAAKAKADKIKKTTPVKTLIETPSLKDELKKRGVDTKPVKDKAKTNWLDTAKKGDTLKYVINKPKAETKKEDSKKGALPKAIDKAVRAIDGNQPGSGQSLKFTGDKSKVAGKDKWGRSPSSKWYGFNPESKKYEAPTMVKGDNKKSDTKVETKKPATTPKVTAPKTTTPKASTPAVKKAEPVGTLAPKSTTEIANKSLEEAKTITPTATSTSSDSSASTSTSSPKVTGVQPRASFINKVRGVVNESRERRAGRAASRGNEERSERLKEKISETEKKMMMKKGGIVKSKSKKK